MVTDDNATPFERNDGGLALDGPIAPTGGLVDVIYEGQDFEGVFHRQIVATLAPSAGVISLPNESRTIDISACTTATAMACPIATIRSTVETGTASSNRLRL